MHKIFVFHKKKFCSKSVDFKGGHAPWTSRKNSINRFVNLLCRKNTTSNSWSWLISFTQLKHMILFRKLPPFEVLDAGGPAPLYATKWDPTSYWNMGDPIFQNMGDRFLKVKWHYLILRMRHSTQLNGAPYIDKNSNSELMKSCRIRHPNSLPQKGIFESGSISS